MRRPSPADEEFEAFLLEVLSDFQITIPEIGTMKAEKRPMVVVTSNRTRDVHDALKRRCLYHWISYPTFEKEYSILRTRLPGIDERLAGQVFQACPGSGDPMLFGGDPRWAEFSVAGVGPRLVGERLPEHDGHVLAGVVVVHLQVAPARKDQVPARVQGQGVGMVGGRITHGGLLGSGLKAAVRGGPGAATETVSMRIPTHLVKNIPAEAIDAV